jgi:mono/diheme cytochrome c family protein
VSTHEKANPKQESTHAADLQGFEDDKPFTAGLGAFVAFLGIGVVSAIVATTQILPFWIAKDTIAKDNYVRADTVAFRQKDQALAQKGGSVSASVEIQGRTQNVTYDVAPTSQGIQYLIKHPQYFKAVPAFVVPTAPAPAPVVRREVPKPAPVVRREVPKPAPVVRREVPKPAPVVRREAPKPAPLDAASLAAGKKLYMANACWTCHGNDGQGNGPVAAGLAVKPANFVLGNYKYGGNLGDIYKVLSQGSPNKASGMVAYAHIPSNDRWSIAKYILSLKKAK